MSRRGRREPPGERGASAVEFALIVPLLMVLLFGIISFGIVFAQELALSNGAREGARHAVVGGRTCGDIQELASDAASTIAMDPADVTVTVRRGATEDAAVEVCAGADTAVPCEDSAAGDSVFVRLEFTSELIVPLVVTDNDFELEGLGVFRCEFS